MSAFSFVDIDNPPVVTSGLQMQRIAEDAGGGQFFRFDRNLLLSASPSGFPEITAPGQTVAVAYNALNNGEPDADQNSSSDRAPWHEGGMLFVPSSNDFIELGRPWPAAFTLFVRATCTQNGVVIGNYRQETNFRSFLSFSSGRPNWRMGTGSVSHTDYPIGSDSLLNDDVCIAVKWDGTNLRFFINGEFISSATPTAPKLNVTDDIWLGKANFPDGTLTSVFGGTIHALCVLDNAVADAVVTEVSEIIGWGNSNSVSVPLESAIILPAVSGVTPTRYPVCTGLARLPDGKWAVGDHGKYLDTDPYQDAGVILYTDETFTSQFRRYSWASLGIGSNRHTCQGVSVDPRDGTVYAVCKAQTNEDGSTVIVQIDPTVSAGPGAVLRTIPVTRSTNGIAIDYDNDQILTLIGNLFRRLDLATGATIGATVTIPDLSGPDMLFYRGEDKMLLSHGGNGTNGFINQYDIAVDPVLIRPRFALQGNVAIEGVVVWDGDFVTASDARYHPPRNGEPAENQIMFHSAAGLV